MARDIIYCIGLLSALLSMGSCVTSTTSTSSKFNPVRTIILNETDTILQSDFGGWNTWKCRDFIYGGRILVEVGNFLDADMKGLGFVLLDGGNKGKKAVYDHSGLNHRWNWDLDESDNSYNYTFVIKPDGTGLFYDFSSITRGETIKASDIFVCRQ